MTLKSLLLVHILYRPRIPSALTTFEVLVKVLTTLHFVQNTVVEGS